jgi:hypothetical protein
MEDRRNVVLDISEKDEIVHIRRNRAEPLARLDREHKTLYWRDQDYWEKFHKSVEGFLEAEKVTIDTVLMEGQSPDVVPKNAPACPEIHFLQGDCTPAFVEWLLKYKPIDFQNRFGVYLIPLGEDQPEPKDPRDRWLRADVIRTDSRAVEGTHGGEYRSTRFKMKDQVIARRATHITFTKKEIFKGDKATDQVIPYDDPYKPEKLALMEKRGEIEVVYRGKHAAGSAGANF